MKFDPAVFVVEDNYQIMVPVSSPSLMWIKIGGKCYYDECNGVMRSSNDVHKIKVPKEALDKTGAYTVCERRIPRRRAYFSKPKNLVETVYRFHPVPEKNAKAVLMSDAHSRVIEPIKAAKNFGDFDFLIFNGDMQMDSASVKNLLVIFEIAAALTGGTKPIVFSRGNHDLRGIMAEKHTDYAPDNYGSFYYTFRLGSIWGVVLDCGEDKPDDHPEYGGTVCCHEYRLNETEFLKKVCDSDSYLAEGIETRIVIAHNPFTRVLPPPFDIEKDTYKSWAKMIKEKIKPHAMLCGHIHTEEIYKVGCKYDGLGQPCDIIVAGKPDKKYYAAAGITFGDTKITVDFIDSDNKKLGTFFIEK
ncbi:MAG: metallophosphoesterase [Clostridia bacterium]|nr:metallophosphoesterase [Clostridia bacterium]